MRRGRVLLGVCVLACVFAAGASADWAGSDPKSNYVVGALPQACTTAPTGATCVNAAVYYLDQARAKLGQAAYKLPADFPSLTPVEQAFVLTNLDRVLYGLPPVPGLTADLNNDALVSGVEADSDPLPTGDGILSYTANWAGGYENLPLAYEAWVYDDGIGSSNIDCTSGNTSGCWGHRHDILWEFDPSDVLAMGAAVGKDSGGRTGYAMLLGGGSSGYAPAYTYTWSQAVADGAGTNDYNPGVPQTTVCTVPAVVGKKLAAAKREIAAAHCGTGKVVKKYSPYVKGTVFVQKPPPGTQLAPGAKVKLVVSKGRRRR